MFRIYVERKEGFQNEASRLMSEFKDFLGISGITGVRFLNRYDVENISEAVANAAATRIFSEPQSDFYYLSEVPVKDDETVIVWEYLPGQYDQRADSAQQCLLILREGLAGTAEVGSNPPIVRCAKMLIISGKLDELLGYANQLKKPEKKAVAKKPAAKKTTAKPAKKTEVKAEKPAAKKAEKATAAAKTEKKK